MKVPGSVTPDPKVVYLNVLCVYKSVIVLYK